MSSIATVTHTTLSNAQNIDPREKMVEQLTVQNETLFDTLDKVSEVYEAASKGKDSAIESLAKTNEELKANLALAQGQLKEMAITHEAEVRDLRAAQAQQARQMLAAHDQVIQRAVQIAKRQKSVDLCQRIAFWRVQGMCEGQHAIFSDPTDGCSGTSSQHVARLMPKLDPVYHERSQMSRWGDIVPLFEAETEADARFIEKELLEEKKQLEAVIKNN